MDELTCLNKQIEVLEERNQALMEQLQLQTTQSDIQVAQPQTISEMFQLETLLDNLPGIAYRCLNDSVWTMQYMSQGCLALTDYRPEEIVGNRIISYGELIHPDDRGKVRQTVETAVQNNRPFELTYRIIARSGSEKWVWERGWCTPEVIDGIPVLEGFITEITNLKKTEGALRASEERYRQIIETTEEGVWLLDTDGKTTFVNRRMAEMLQYTPAQMMGKHLFEFMDEEDQLVAQENLKRRRQGISEQHDFKFRCRDGTDLWTIIATNPIMGDEGNYLGTLGMITDITERKQAQEDLEKYARLLQTMRNIDRAILEAQSPITIANKLLDRLQDFLPIVRASILLIDWETNMGEVLTGYSRFATQVGPGSRRPMSEFGLHEELLKGELIVREDLRKVKNPSPVMKILEKEGIFGFIGVPLVLQGDVIGVLYLSADKPNAFTDEHIEIARELAYSLSVVIQQARLMEQIQQHASELEQRVADRTRELEEANERLKIMDRLKSKFVSDITHELRTPVTNMLLYLDLMRFSDSENNERYQIVLHEQVERLRQLVQDSLDLSRLDLAQDSVKLLLLDVNSIVSQAVKDFGELAEDKGLTLNFTPEISLPKLLVDGGQTSRVIGCLLQNAINFSPTGGQVQVCILMDETAEFAGIRVQDNGIGFTEEDRKHCFEPFYRGEQVGQFNIPGNGLGLTLLKRIVDLHNGRIEIESVVDQGSTITIWLPIAGQP